MPAKPVLWDLDQRGVATVTLNRPEVNNAYDGRPRSRRASHEIDELARSRSFASLVLNGQRQALSGRRRPEMDQCGCGRDSP